METIKCKNCEAPINVSSKISSKYPTITCEYCNHSYKNPVYNPPVVRSTTFVPGSSAPQRRLGMWLPIILIALAGTVSYFMIGTSVSNTIPKTIPGVVNEKTQISVPGATDMPPDEAAAKAYVSCMDRTFPRAQQSIERYLSWVDDPQTGPTCTERYVSWGLYQMYEDSIANCTEAMASAIAAQPAWTELHPQAQAFAQAGKSLIPIMAEAENYYEKKMYKMDNCGTGQRLHAPLMTHWETLNATHEKLAALLRDKTRGFLDRCLSRTAQNPNQVAAHQWANLINKTLGVIATFSTEQSKPEPNVNIYKQQISILNQAATVLYAQSSEQLRAAGYFGTYQMNIDNLLESAMAFYDQAQNPRKPSRRPRPSADAPQKGELAHVIAAFNAVLSDYNNNMRICGPVIPCHERQCPAPEN